MNIIEACEVGDLNRVKELIKAGADLEIQDEDEQTPLTTAMNNCNLEIVEELILSGANVDRKVYGIPMIMFTDLLDVIRILLDNGADPDASQDGETALFRHSRWADVEIIEELLAAGANVNVQNKYGHTPLYEAVSNLNLECVKVLLEAGAYPNILTNAKESPLYKIRKLQESYIDSFRKNKILELLKQNGAIE